MDDQATRLRMLVEGKITKEDTMDSGRLQGSSQSTAHQPVSQGARVIAITSGKGGVGKTNLTVNLAIAMGKKDHAIFLDTATLQYEYVPLQLDGAKIVIACSNKKRGLADSKYNERRSQCEQALADLQQVIGIETLGQLDCETFDRYQSAIKDEVKRRRAKHAVYENQRTIRAKEDLCNKDLAGFGRLMNESHVSLQEDYEVTGFEMDTLAQAAWKQDGVIGSRITGGGFGGCTVSLVKEESVPAFIEAVGKEYSEKTKLKADFYVVEIGGGPVVF